MTRLYELTISPSIVFSSTLPFKLFFTIPTEASVDISFKSVDVRGSPPPSRWMVYDVPSPRADAALFFKTRLPTSLAISFFAVLESGAFFLISLKLLFFIPSLTLLIRSMADFFGGLGMLPKSFFLLFPLLKILPIFLRLPSPPPKSPPGPVVEDPVPPC